MKSKKVKKTIKPEDWPRYKASQCRSNWRARAKKAGIDLVIVPTRAEIEEFINSQGTVKMCYLTDSMVKLEDVELDHKVPINRGGTFSLDNVGITSKHLNSAKGIMTDEEFKSLLQCIHTWEDEGMGLLKRLVASNNIYRSYSRKKK